MTAKVFYQNHECIHCIVFKLQAIEIPMVKTTGKRSPGVMETTEFNDEDYSAWGGPFLSREYRLGEKSIFMVVIH